MDIKQSSTNANANGRDDSSELIEREQYKDTPFEIITVEKEHWIGMGMFKLSEKVKNKKILTDRIDKKDWWFITTVINTVIQADKMRKEVKEEEAKENNEY